MNIVLVGFMASGKTAVGRRVARRLGYSFLDTDQLIEAEIGCSIAKLFEEKGEEAFRRLESAVAENLHQLKNHVISTGGGILTQPDNLERLRRAGLVTFLNADQEEIIERLQRDTRRPLVQGGDVRTKVTTLLAERLAMYAKSDVVIDTKALSVNQVSSLVIRALCERTECGGRFDDVLGEGEEEENEKAPEEDDDFEVR